jgi:hypothetical protein
MFLFALFNIFALALLGYANVLGFWDMALEADGTHLVVLILGLAMASAVHHAYALSRFGSRDYWANCHKATVCERIKLDLSTKFQVLSYEGTVLVALGIIGTVIGMIHAFSGVNAETAGDITQVGAMVGRLIEGMGIALWTTLVGAIMNIWAHANTLMVQAYARQKLARHA